MTFPDLPINLSSIKDLKSEDVAILLLSSIAHEEIALAHLINVEAEKLQAAVGTLIIPPATSPNPKVIADTFEDFLDINRSVARMMQTIIKKEMLLQFKFDNVLEFLDKVSITPCIEECDRKE